MVSQILDHLIRDGDALRLRDLAEDELGARRVDRLELDRPAEAPNRRGPPREPVVVVRDEDNWLARSADRVDDGPDASRVLAADEVIRFVEGHELTPSGGGRQEFAASGERLGRCTSKRDLSDRLGVPPVGGIHLDDRPAHVICKGDCGACLPRTRRARENHRASVGRSLFPGSGPPLELGDGRRISDHLVEGLRAVFLRPRRHRPRKGFTAKKVSAGTPKVARFADYMSMLYKDTLDRLIRAKIIELGRKPREPYFEAIPPGFSHTTRTAPEGTRRTSSGT